MGDVPRLKALALDVRVRKYRERAWGLLVGLLVLGLVLSAVGAGFVEGHKFYRSWQEEFTVLPKESRGMAWTLSEGTIIEMNATVSGGNNDIRIFVVDDKTGRTVKDFGRLVSPISVRFEAPKDGNYTVYFDNTFSTLMPKDVKVTASLYEVNTRFWALVLLISGVTSVALAIVFLIIGNVPVLVLEDGESMYTFKLDRSGKIRVWVDGVEVPGDQVEDHSVFKIGPNDEHVLEIKKKRHLGVKRWIFKVDGREVGRLP